MIHILGLTCAETLDLALLDLHGMDRLSLIKSLESTAKSLQPLVALGNPEPERLTPFQQMVRDIERGEDILNKGSYGSADPFAKLLCLAGVGRGLGNCDSVVNALRRQRRVSSARDSYAVLD